jgi:hypothetical protein
MSQRAAVKKPRRICVNQDIFAAFKTTRQVRIDDKLHRQYKFQQGEVVLLIRDKEEFSVVVETDSEHMPIFRL